MIRIHSGANVWDAALDRIRWLFDEFALRGKPLGVSTSGGKDSTVLFELARIVAREKGIERIPLMWLDQECEYDSTVEYVRWQMHEPDVEPLWMQVPFRLTNSTSHSREHEFLRVWDPALDESQWMRPKEPDSLHENVYGTDRFYDILSKIGDFHFAGGASMCGMRAEEAPGRRLGLTGSPSYKWVTWAWMGHDHLLFSPIYDWTWRDIWKAIHDNGWNYNTHYDALYQHGVPTQKMRVSNYHHETAIWSLFHLQEIEPESYARATQRLEGIHTTAHLGKKDFKPTVLPYMFDSWLEYRDYLFEHLLLPEHQDKYRAKFAQLRRSFPAAYEEMGEALAKAEAHSIISNDYEFVLLSSAFFSLPKHLGRGQGRDDYVYRPRLAGTSDWTELGIPGWKREAV